MSSCCCGSLTLAVRAVKSGRRDIKRARKPHKCIECKRVIPRGAPYRYETALIAARWYQYHTCMICASIRDDRFACGWTWGELWADLCECLGGGFAEPWLDPPTEPIKVTS